MTVDGRLFHALAAATRNTRSPSDDLLVAGMTSAGELDDLRRYLGSRLSVNFHKIFGNNKNQLDFEVDLDKRLTPYHLDPGVC